VSSLLKLGVYFLFLCVTSDSIWYEIEVVEDLLILELIVNYIAIYFVYLFGCIYLK
jgi:hypothetical protein